MMFLIVLWQDRQNRRMKFSTARVVAAYHNELTVARDHISRLSSEYTQAKRILDEYKEASLALRLSGAKRDAVPANSKNTAAATSDGQPAREQLLIENGNLKQQVKTLTNKVQEEQQKNRKLKGE